MIDYNNPWLYDGKPFVSEDINDAVGFVYLITNLTSGMKYIGKKNFWAIRTLPPLKGKTRKRKKKTESDWKDYYGSSEEVKTLVESQGRDNFKREILHICDSKGEMSYYELKEQVENDVLFKPDEYYNAFVGAKIHRKHVLK